MPTAQKKKESKAVRSVTQANLAARPSWPPFDSAIPHEDLVCNELVPDQIVTISPFWSSAVCKRYVSFLSDLPLTTTNGTPKRGDAVRVNDRYQIDDPVFAQTLWDTTGLKEAVLGVGDDEAANQALWGGQVLGLNSNVRIYRYRPGQFFDQHCKLPNLAE